MAARKWRSTQKINTNSMPRRGAVNDGGEGWYMRFKRQREERERQQETTAKKK